MTFINIRLTRLWRKVDIIALIKQASFSISEFVDRKHGGVQHEQERRQHHGHQDARS